MCESARGQQGTLPAIAECDLRRPVLRCRISGSYVVRLLVSGGSSAGVAFVAAQELCGVGRDWVGIDDACRLLVGDVFLITALVCCFAVGGGGLVVRVLLGGWRPALRGRDAALDAALEIISRQYREPVLAISSRLGQTRLDRGSVSPPQAARRPLEVVRVGESG